MNDSDVVNFKFFGIATSTSDCTERLSARAAGQMPAKGDERGETRSGPQNGGTVEEVWGIWRRNNDTRRLPVCVSL